MVAEDNGAIRITLRDVYDSVEEIKERLVPLESVADHETRIRILERRVWALPSFATLIAIASLVAAFMAVKG